MFGCIIFALLGFIGFEVSVRIVDQKPDFIERIGFKRYIIYLLGYGVFMAALGGVLANAIPVAASMQYLIAILAGYSFPSGGRLGIGALTRLVFTWVLRTQFGPDALTPPNQDPNDSKRSQDKRSTSVVDEIADGRVRSIDPKIIRYRKVKQIIEDVFGF